MKKMILVILFVFFGIIESKAAISFNAVQNLSFGAVIQMSQSGSFSMGADGILNTNGSVYISSAGFSHQGIVELTDTEAGDTPEHIFFYQESSSVNLMNEEGRAVQAQNFVIDGYIGSISSSQKTATINIGGTITFNSNATPGTYTGSVNIRTRSLNSAYSDLVVSLPISFKLFGSLSGYEVSPLCFGEIGINNGSAKIRVNRSANVNIISGAENITILSGSNPMAHGRFEITGDKNTMVSVTTPSTITLTNETGATMIVDRIRDSFRGTPSSLGGNGKRDLYIGADLNIGPNQAPGTYHGTYTINVDY